MSEESKKLNRKEAIEYLQINKKEFDNYLKFSKEIPSTKNTRGWYILNESDLDVWKELKEQRTVFVNLSEYESCFEFAIKMAYSPRGSYGTGIRGARSEVQMADDFILGILAEHGVKKFLHQKLNLQIELDEEVHPGEITPQDIVGVIENGTSRETNIDIAIKASKMKSCFIVIPPREYEADERSSDIYIFARVGLPSDHLFRILQDHSFFKNVKEFLDKEEDFRKIEELGEIPIWITGFSYHEELERVNEIPGQKFEGKEGISDYRYVKSVADLHNSDEDWQDILRSI